ncbi:MAG: cytochrome b/b6 domain-containing protein [Candidatus Marinimicrobia bacterium]|nr:cytochrome b/b6 domain-containing protein [Candidatus Neomarinimicrobiota bacterium]
MKNERLKLGKALQYLVLILFLAFFAYGDDFECLDCHEDMTAESVHDGVVSCQSCHEDVEDESHMEEGAAAVECSMCHYEQSVVSKSSMHYHLGEDGPSCTDCHDSHQVQDRVHPDSKISNLMIPETCGQCHEDIVIEYKNSVHWNEAKRGIKEAPVCTDCHITHNYNPGENPNALADTRKMQEETCVRCHDDPVLRNKYETLDNQAYSYRDSYHGMAVVRGDENAAMCVDCHNVHSILGREHPESSVNEANIVNTCSQCHDGASFVFANSYSHKAYNESAATITHWVKKIYIWVIFIVIGGMVAHNLMITISHLIRERRKTKANMIPIPRFTKNEIVQHYLLLTSFIILAITGFMLRMPESWWAVGLTNLGISETIRQFIHRTSAVINGITGIYHVYYLIATSRGRDVLFSLFPGVNDATEAVGNIAYYLGLKKDRPEFGQYDYAEKAEYWALIWGTVVMGATGAVLWFPTLIGDWAPYWLIKVSEIVHYYEAILATLAIIVWHWFFVLFNPETKMSFAWLDGKVSLSDYKHHHMRKFKYVLREWKLLKMGNIEKEELKPYTALVMETLENHDYNPDDVFQKVIDGNEPLKEWLEKNINS